MSYLVLARKYRPRSFAEVTGQENVTRTLQGAIAEGRVAHAYLFCGPRGTGKTTTARIFAKALNCEQGPGVEPCGECERCRAADAGSEIDIIEIDAASHTGVENVRELREQAIYAPIRARYKVYIVDEVHMLSRPAFNALLKTLEEPPSHVKFLFATTELHKVPDTILSRCQVLKLSPLAESTIAARLSEVFERESVLPEAGVVEALARRARGGMRDALSLADQLLALVGSAPTLEDVRRLSAGADRELIEGLTAALAARDRAAVLALLPSVEGGEAELLDTLLQHLRGALLCHLCGLDNPHVEGDQALRQRLAASAQAFGVERLELLLEELLATRERMRLLPGQARLVLEVALLAQCRPEAGMPLGELAARLLALEERLGSARPAAAREAAGSVPAALPETSSPPAPRTAARAPSARAMRSSAAETWKQFVEALARAAPSLGELFRRCGALVELAEGRALVRLERLHEEDRALIQAPRNRQRFNEVLTRLLEREMELEIQDAAAMRPGNEDPFTREVADLFGGRIEG